MSKRNELLPHIMKAISIVFNPEPGYGLQNTFSESYSHFLITECL